MLLDQNRVSVVPSSNGIGVKTVRIVLGSAVMENARAGSFGILRTRIAPKAYGGHAGIVFDHKPTQERALAAA